MNKNKAKTSRKISSKVKFLIFFICLVGFIATTYFVFARNSVNSNETLNIQKSQNLLDVCDGVSVACGSRSEEAPKHATEPVINNTDDDDSVRPVTSGEVIISDDITGESTDHTFGSGLTIKFPTDWKLKHTNRIYRYLNGEPNYESIDKSLITSPDGQATVKFELIMQGQHDGPKYATGPYDEYRLKMLEFEQLPNYRDLYFSSYFTEYEALNSSKYYVGVNSDFKFMSSLKSNDTVGSLFSGEINPVSQLSDRAILLWLEVNFSNLDLDLSVDNFEAIKSTSNYAIAKQIIESLHIKK